MSDMEVLLIFLAFLAGIATYGTIHWLFRKQKAQYFVSWTVTSPRIEERAGFKCVVNGDTTIQMDRALASTNLPPLRTYLADETAKRVGVVVFPSEVNIICVTRLEK